MVMRLTEAKVLGAPRVDAPVSPELLGGPAVRLQESLGKATGEINDFMLARQDQLDVISVMTAESEWTIAEDAKINDFLSRKGENAFEMLGEAEQWFDGYGSEPQPKPGEKRTSGAKIGPGGKISEGFRENRYGKMNDRQKMAFDRLRIKRRSSFLKSVGAHENKERLASIIRSSDSLIASHTADAIRNYLRPEQMKDNIARIEASVNAKSRAAGLSEVEANRDREVAMATIHNGVLTQYLASDDHEGASEYLKKHKGALEGKSLPMMQSAIRAKKVTTEGLLQAREIMKLDPDKRDAALAKITDADIQKEALTNVWRLDSQETKAKTFARKQSQSSVYTKLWEKDKSGNYVLPDLNTIVGTDEWNKLDASDQETFRKMLVARDVEYPTVSPEDSLTEMNKLYELPREEFLEKFNPVDYFGKLSKQDMNTMKSRRDTFTQEGQDDDFADVDKAVTNQMQRLGWSASAGDSPRMGAYRIEAGKLYSDWLRTHNNEKPTTAEWQGELDKMSTSKQQQIEGQYKRPRPKAVGTETDPRTQENMEKAFADINWLNSQGKPEAYYNARSAQLTTIINKKVSKYKRLNGRTPDEDWYQRQIELAGGDIATNFDWVNEDKLVGALTPEEEKNHYVTVTEALPDKDYSIADIKAWAKKNPDAAARVGAELVKEGKPLYKSNIAVKIYRWEKAQETKVPDIRSPIKTTPKKPKTKAKGEGLATASQAFAMRKEYIKTAEKALKQIEARYPGNRLGQFLGIEVIALKKAALDKDKEAFLKTWDKIKKDIVAIDGEGVE